MKKSLVLTCALLALCLLFAGCRDFTKDRNKTKGITGNYQAEVLGLRMENKDTDQPLMYVKFAFTNNSSAPISLDKALDPTAYQDDMILTPIKEEQLTAADEAPIEPGSTHEIEVIYALHDAQNKQIRIDITNHETGEKVSRIMELLL